MFVSFLSSEYRYAVASRGVFLVFSFNNELITVHPLVERMCLERGEGFEHLKNKFLVSVFFGDVANTFKLHMILFNSINQQ